MSWIEKVLPSINKKVSEKRSIPEGVWTKCSACGQVLYRPELTRNLEVCMKCDHHMRIKARSRLQHLFDKDGKTIELDADLTSTDFLNFIDLKKYKDRINSAKKNTGENEVIISQVGYVDGVKMVVIAFEFDFMGGSMGSAVGEKFRRAAEYAINQQLPLVSFSASGGARMQEALFSLMQMAKTSAVIGKIREHKLPFISVLTDPTMGGVSASFATLGDLNIAEPNALIGFAGPRVIEQTVREKLPEGFQKSEFLLKCGALDKIIHRKNMAKELAKICKILLKHNP